jgi:hypothetical protein
MQYMETKDVLVGDFLLEYDLDKISKFNSQITEKNLFISLFSKKFEDTEFQKEPHYNTEYKEERISQFILESFNQPFHLWFYFY